MPCSFSVLHNFSVNRKNVVEESSEDIGYKDNSVCKTFIAEKNELSSFPLQIETSLTTYFLQMSVHVTCSSFIQYSARVQSYTLVEM